MVGNSNSEGEQNEMILLAGAVLVLNAPVAHADDDDWWRVNRPIRTLRRRQRRERLDNLRRYRRRGHDQRRDGQ